MSTTPYTNAANPEQTIRDLWQENQRLYDALKRIASYDSPEKLRRNSFRAYGLEDANEAIEYAYENVRAEAKAAIRGMRRPQAKDAEAR